MDATTAETRLLDTAAALFNERGVQAVGMDTIRTASGVSLKRLYQLFPSKEDLVEAVLRRRSRDLLDEIPRYADARGETPQERILAVFDYLHEWFGSPAFRGCNFINSFGELGGVSEGVAEVARTHKKAFAAHFAELAAAAGAPPALAPQLAVLANGAMASAGISGSREPARHAQEAARVLLAHYTLDCPPSSASA
ncbi:TetR/AcrR family transcriptional regulator [Streptomyces spiramyceticus]|uniref:TetR/AcrR family transcriptional regulator n=1 Tax=Streptomyces spiramyceticus TaxID=299717 RepID=UPI00237B8212|nr:TetR/AcrR family transcriptional regulator [Streptomyces spiramyceticus]